MAPLPAEAATKAMPLLPDDHPEPSFSTVTEPPAPKDVITTSDSSLSMDGVSLTRHEEDDSMAFLPLQEDAVRSTSAAAKHKSLGALPRRLDPPSYAESPSLASSQRRAGALRHRSLMRRERSKESYGRATPSFLDSLAERVRSVSPTPQSLSSDPSKIIANIDANPELRAGSKKSFSLGSHSRATSAFSSVDWKGKGDPNGGIGSFSITPSNSRSGSGFPGEAPAPRSQQLSSTSLRRVLSLGRPRMDSDAYSAVSEPIVYAESAHVADDIWIAPKELYEVERRVAMQVERRAKEKRAAQLNAQRRAEERHAAVLNRQRELATIVPKRTAHNFSLQGARAAAEESGNPVAMEIDTARAAEVVEMDLDDPPRKDPSEFVNADTSSRLLRLFFSSGSQNPVPPSAAKRAEERGSSRGSSRHLLFRRGMSDRSRSQMSYASHRNLHAAAMSGDAAAPSFSTPAPVVDGAPEAGMSHDFDLKGRIRGLGRFVNVRRWLRSRAYRKHQRRPERRPREAVV